MRRADDFPEKPRPGRHGHLRTAPAYGFRPRSKRKIFMKYPVPHHAEPGFSINFAKLCDFVRPCQTQRKDGQSPVKKYFTYPY